MSLLLALAVSVALPSTFTIDLSEGKQLQVINDLSNPFLAAHELQVNVFLGSGGEGLIRMSSEVAGIHGLLNPGPIVGWHVDQLKYEISVHELVGIAVSPQPRVYIVNGIPPLPAFKSKDADAAYVETSKPSVFDHVDWTAILSRDDGHAHFCRDLPTAAWKKEIRGDDKIEVIIRDTDWFEDAAIQQLRDGHAFCTTTTTNGAMLRGVGAIRAMTSCLRCHDENKEGDLLGAFTYFTSTTFFNLADYSKRSTTYHDVLQLVTKVSTKQLANLIEANAKDATLWEALQKEPRPRTPEMSWFVRHDPPIQLELALASYGFVRPRLVSFIQQERATLEQTHRAKMIDAHPWTSAPERTVHKSN